MLIKPTPDLRESEVTPRDLYLRRREFIGAAGAAAAALATGAIAPGEAAAQNPSAQKLANLKKSSFSTTETMNSYRDVTTYNNFYEFGLDKGDPARHAHALKPRPWSIKVEGECAKPGTYNLEDILKWFPLEERIYRMRCVEGWSMVIPWVGYPLAELIRRVEPTGNAKYIEYDTLADPRQMPGVRSRVLDWPYVEGLRLDEAMHPLTLLCVGLYGETLPNQCGAPVRVVVPWKYGFKSGKSIVRIRFLEKQPKTSWEAAAPSEYGFYSNVNPQVDHPRWSQATERRIGEDGFRQKKRKTLPFNGYGDQVSSLYAGMDLRKFF